MKHHRKLFHSVCRSEEMKGGIANSTTTIDSAGSTVEESFDAFFTICPYVLWCFPHQCPYVLWCFPHQCLYVLWCFPHQCLYVLWSVEESFDAFLTNVYMYYDLLVGLVFYPDQKCWKITHREKDYTTSSTSWELKWLWIFLQWGEKRFSYSPLEVGAAAVSGRLDSYSPLEVGAAAVSGRLDSYSPLEVGAAAVSGRLDAYYCSHCIINLLNFQYPVCCRLECIV